GYMGGEALRVLLEHPQVSVAWVTSRSGKPVSSYHRNLYGMDLAFVPPDRAGPCDVVFAALPAGEIMKLAPKLLDAGTKIIDLGADFRLKDRETWERKYARPHIAWELVKEAVYGIPELHREKIRKARVIANPGCYASAVILGLAPLIARRLIDPEKIIADGLSGTAGVGAEPDLLSHHPEIANNVIPYNVVDHRHTYEMEQELGLLAGRPVTVHFTPSYIPISRGIVTVCHCFPEQRLSRADLLEIYRDHYAGERFVKIFDLPAAPEESWHYRPYPWVAAVSGTNYCHIGLEVDEKRQRIAVLSVLDSVGKGGAHAGVQNMNLLFGLPEKTGLTRAGLHPY
ncbi:MAG TPA: N-acetyl-gamma-glutamyl-phosphate reductase, partial [Spirochaetia bacterium]|nr:N-acetyl-gamma-glutamyl-phosphate reductase [Spirochaetia bacterium]